MNPYTLNEFLNLNPLTYNEFNGDTCRVYMTLGEVGRISLYHLSDYGVIEANTQFVVLSKKP